MGIKDKLNAGMNTFAMGAAGLLSKNKIIDESKKKSEDLKIKKQVEKQQIKEAELEITRRRKAARGDYSGQGSSSSSSSNEQKKPPQIGTKEALEERPGAEPPSLEKQESMTETALKKTTITSVDLLGDELGIVESPPDIIKEKELKEAAISDQHRRELQSVYAIFIDIKKCMAIPHKPQRAYLEEDHGWIEEVDAVKMEQIVRDKIVLHHTGFIEDIEKLMELAKKLNKPGQEKNRDLQEQYHQNMDRLLTELKAKQEYVKMKQDWIKALAEQAKNPEANLPEKTIHQAFKIYCQSYDYRFDPIGASEFKDDPELQALKAKEKSLRHGYVQNFLEYFKFTISLNRGIEGRVDELLGGFTDTIAELKSAVEKSVQDNKAIRTAVKGTKNFINIFSTAWNKLTTTESKEETSGVELQNITEAKQVPAHKEETTIEQEEIKQARHKLVKKLYIDDSLLKKNLSAQRELVRTLSEQDKTLTTLQATNLSLKKEIERIEKELSTPSVGVKRLFDHAIKIFERIKPSPNEEKASEEAKAEEPKTLTKKKAKQINNYEQANIELRAVLDQLELHKKHKDKLKGKTLHEEQIKAKLNTIKTLHQRDWKKIMQIQFGTEARRIVRDTRQLKAFFQEMKPNLEVALQSPSFMDKFVIPAGETFARILGGATLGGAIATFTPIPTAAGIGIGAAATAVIEAALYNKFASRPENKNVNPETLKSDFENELKTIGFDSEAREKLSNELMQLFLFRFCMLSSQGVGNVSDMRSLFLSRKGIKGKDHMNATIETLFQEEFGALLQGTFGDIYESQKTKIEKDTTFMQRRFESVKKAVKGEENYYELRSIATADLQIDVYKIIIELFRANINFCGTGNINRSNKRILGSIIFGLTIGGAALAIGIVLEMEIVIIAAAIALSLVILFAARSMYKSYVSAKTALKAHSESAVELTEVLNQLEKENKRVSNVKEKKAKAGLEDLRTLEEIKNDEMKKGIHRAINFFRKLSKSNNQILIGGAGPWLSYFSSIYEHSLFVENDLQPEIQAIIEVAAQQTEDLQVDLLDGLMGEPEEPFAVIKAFIQKTEDYLSDPKNKRKIEKFNLKQKVKDQLLEVISALPPKKDWKSGRELPTELMAFYKKLGGSEHDFDMVVNLNSIQTAQNIAQELQDEMARSSAVIFGGNNSYRQLLELRELPNGIISRQALRLESLNKDNIFKYLTNSYLFLLSLDKQNIPEGMGDTYKHSEKFIMYRTLLLKQLAELVDPTHANYDQSLEDIILDFVKKQFHFEDPIAVLRTIQHQEYISKLPARNQDEGYEYKSEQFNMFKGSDEDMLDAVRLNLSLENRKSPASLLVQEIPALKQDLGNRDNVRIFGFTPGIVESIGDDPSGQYLHDLQDVMDETESRLKEMIENPNLSNYKVPEIYIANALKDIKVLDTQIRLRLNLKEEKAQAVEEKKELAANESDVGEVKQAPQAASASSSSSAASSSHLPELKKQVLKKLPIKDQEQRSQLVSAREDLAKLKSRLELVRLSLNVRSKLAINSKTLTITAPPGVARPATSRLGFWPSRTNARPKIKETQVKRDLKVKLQAVVTHAENNSIQFNPEDLRQMKEHSSPCLSICAQLLQTCSLKKEKAPRMEQQTALLEPDEAPEEVLEKDDELQEDSRNSMRSSSSSG